MTLEEMFLVIETRASLAQLAARRGHTTIMRQHVAAINRMTARIADALARDNEIEHFLAAPVVNLAATRL